MSRDSWINEQLYLNQHLKEVDSASISGGVWSWTINIKLIDIFSEPVKVIIPDKILILLRYDHFETSIRFFRIYCLHELHCFIVDSHHRFFRCACFNANCLSTRNAISIISRRSLLIHWASPLQSFMKLDRILPLFVAFFGN